MASECCPGKTTLKRLRDVRKKSISYQRWTSQHNNQLTGRSISTLFYQIKLYVLVYGIFESVDKLMHPASGLCLLHSPCLLSHYQDYLLALQVGHLACLDLVAMPAF